MAVWKESNFRECDVAEGMLDQVSATVGSGIQRVLREQGKVQGM
jgi:hypothetical protein